ncbi:MAG: hypothetical protein A2046_08430 [Bacteroidetes bacterium GWA2_30_7]|nr:MAG: hypothetical protein A2046_08430 [Bacteroidetes bacterium GWA2_30_7]
MDFLRFFFKLTFRKVFNYFAARLSFIISKVFLSPFVFAKPYSLTLEPNNFCNLKCTECPTGMNTLTRNKGNMDFELAKNAIDKLKNDLIYLMLYFQGEPFMASNFFEIIKYANKSGVYTATSTNGHFLTPENCENIINSGLDRIIISIDGTSQETYSKYRSGGSLDKVLKGLETLYNTKNNLKKSNPFIIIQFLVFKFNEHQIPEIKKIAKKYNSKLELKTAQIYNFSEVENLLPTQTKYSRYKKLSNGEYRIKTSSKSCLRLWSHLVITWDGKIIPCCFDKNASICLGNFPQQNLLEVWKSNQFNNFRQELLVKKSEIEICENCNL